ncbi:MAG: hypothetical protein KDA80_02715 [Planctomycetaceae bacterium]|nr:hypothetical protein [Planctomycetaceae bacterium]
MLELSRRSFLSTSLTMAAGGFMAPQLLAQAPAWDVSQRSPLPEGVEILFPRDRVPLSFIIDDSTCLVNMGHFCMPQFAEAWPDREVYKKPWQSWPREIPDVFVREFGEWCGENGVKGKYSIVPNPACVGWLDRELPGWSRRQLQDSLKLVRELMLPNWDIHPEMITHTRVINLKTGRPIEEINAGTMENSFPQVKKSVDELAEYIAYALRILKNCDLPCEGFTTPGGFGNLVKSELALAARQALADVFQPEIPHYFKYVIGGDGNTEPKLEHVSGVGTDQLEFTVNVPAGTGDWFGSWEGDAVSEPDKYCTADATGGRMVELIERKQPAIMLCHWPGMYCNGTKSGFQAFQRVVTSLADRFGDQTQWMKVSEIARYWTARAFTEIQSDDGILRIKAPFACPQWTLRLPRDSGKQPVWRGQRLREVSASKDLQPGTWLADGSAVVLCVDLPMGASQVSWA